MEWDYQREAEKRTELLRELSETLRDHATPESEIGHLSKAIFDSFVSTRPPQALRIEIGFIVLGHMGSGGGQSTKAGNITLNVGKLVDALASGVLTTAGAAQLKPLSLSVLLAALVIWNSLKRAAKVNISETEAAVLYTMWVHKNAENQVSEDGLLEKCNALLQKYQRPVLSKHMLTNSLKALERIRTIARSKRNPEMWWLREWVRVSYS
jgi:hypothetical protein